MASSCVGNLVGREVRSTQYPLLLCDGPQIFDPWLSGKSINEMSQKTVCFLETIKVWEVNDARDIVPKRQKDFG